MSSSLIVGHSIMRSRGGAAFPRGSAALSLNNNQHIAIFLPVQKGYKSFSECRPSRFYHCVMVMT